MATKAEEYKMEFNGASFSISQEEGDLVDPQQLKIEFENTGGGFYMRLHTGKSGWSVDSPEEMAAILGRFVKIAKALSEAMPERGV